MGRRDNKLRGRTRRGILIIFSLRSSTSRLHANAEIGRVSKHSGNEPDEAGRCLDTTKAGAVRARHNDAPRMAESSLCEALVKLDRKVSRVLQNGAGVKLSSADLELLAAIGVISFLAEAKARALEEAARCRRSRAASTSEDHSGSILPEEGTTDPISIDGGSESTPLPSDAGSGRRRAQRIFSPVAL